MTLPKSPQSRLAEIAKYPASYVLMAVVGLLGYFAHGRSDSEGGRTVDCKEQLHFSQQQIAHKDSLIESMAFQIRVQESFNKQLPAVTDSLLRSTPTP